MSLVTSIRSRRDALKQAQNLYDRLAEGVQLEELYERALKAKYRAIRADQPYEGSAPVRIQPGKEFISDQEMRASILQMIRPYVINAEEAVEFVDTLVREDQLRGFMNFASQFLSEVLRGATTLTALEVWQLFLAFLKKKVSEGPAPPSGSASTPPSGSAPGPAPSGPSGPGPAGPAAKPPARAPRDEASELIDALDDIEEKKSEAADGASSIGSAETVVRIPGPTPDLRIRGWTPRRPFVPAPAPEPAAVVVDPARPTDRVDLDEQKSLSDRESLSSMTSSQRAQRAADIANLRRMLEEGEAEWAARHADDMSLASSEELAGLLERRMPAPAPEAFIPDSGPIVEGVRVPANAEPIAPNVNWTVAELISKLERLVPAALRFGNALTADFEEAEAHVEALGDERFAERLARLFTLHMKLIQQMGAPEYADRLNFLVQQLRLLEDADANGRAVDPAARAELGARVQHAAVEGELLVERMADTLQKVRDVLVELRAARIRAVEERMRQLNKLREEREARREQARRAQGSATPRTRVTLDLESKVVSNLERNEERRLVELIEREQPVARQLKTFNRVEQNRDARRQKYADDAVARRVEQILARRRAIAEALRYQEELRNLRREPAQKRTRREEEKADGEATPRRARTGPGPVRVEEVPTPEPAAAAPTPRSVVRGRATPRVEEVAAQPIIPAIELAFPEEKGELEFKEEPQMALVPAGKKKLKKQPMRIAAARPVPAIEAKPPTPERAVVPAGKKPKGKKKAVAVPIAGRNPVERERAPTPPKPKKKERAAKADADVRIGAQQKRFEREERERERQRAVREVEEKTAAAADDARGLTEVELGARIKQYLYTQMTAETVKAAAALAGWDEAIPTKLEAVEYLAGELMAGRAAPALLNDLLPLRSASAIGAQIEKDALRTVLRERADRRAQERAEGRVVTYGTY